jgi:hypothetical protein
MKLIFKIRKDIFKFDLLKFIPLFSLVMFAFMPTSHEGVIYSKYWSLAIWIIIITFITLVAFFNNLDYRLILNGFLFIVIYLGIITVFTLTKNASSHFSLYRVAPVASLVLLTSITIKTKNVSSSFFRRLLDIFFIAMFMWNSLILLGSNFIKEFTMNNYSQYYAKAIEYTFFYKKTVMSFGVHTWASYFYLIMFYLSYVTAQSTNKIRFYLYCGIALLFTVFLTSNSSLVYGTIMAIMLLWLLRKRKALLLLIAGLVVIMLVNYWDVLLGKYLIYINSNTNGIVSRYLSSNSSFANNFKIIFSSLGIGFTILDNKKIGFSDSGYIVYLTMGSIPLLLFIYSRIYNFLVRNIIRKYIWFILFIVFSFEFALPATYSYRFPFVIIFIVYYLKSLSYSEHVTK